MSGNISVFDKTPGEILDYGFDYSAEMAAAGNDAISSSSWTIDAGIGVQSSGNDATGAIVFLNGGTLGNHYIGTNRVSTIGGRTYERTLLVRVVALKYQ